MSKFKNFLNTIKWESLVTAILSLVIGLVFIVNPTNAGDTVCYVSGVVFTLLGAALLIKFFFNHFLFGSYIFVLSALLLTVGSLCLVKASEMSRFFVYLFGFFLIIDGVTKFQEGIDLMQSKVKYSWSVFAVGGVSIALGIAVVFGGVESSLMFCGIALVIDGFCDLFTTLFFSARVRNLEKRVRKLIDDNFDEMTKAMSEDVIFIEESKKEEDKKEEKK